MNDEGKTLAQAIEEDTISAAEAFGRQAIENNGLEMVQASTDGDKREMYKLRDVLAPTEVHLACAVIWGFRPVYFLATYRGVTSGKLVHAIA